MQNVSIVNQYHTNAIKVMQKQKYTKVENLSKPSFSNKYAKEVRTPQYKQRIVKNKKLYDRKKLDKI